MRELALVGTIAVVFGLGSYYATEEFGSFGVVNVAVGVLALGVAALLGIRRFHGIGAPDARRVMGPPLAVLLLCGVAAFGLERLGAWSGLQFDWTAEGHYELADSTCRLMGSPSQPLRATLFRDPFDPRARRTRLLLETLSGCGPLERVERILDEADEEADRFGVGSSNTVVLELDGRFETVERPTEGALYEALQRLLVDPSRYLYLARGEGEGDFRRRDERGYSGLAATLETEGYRLRDLVLAAVSEIPPDAAAVLLLSPERRIPELGLEALRRYLEQGGRLVVFLDPGRASGVEALLRDYGFEVPDRLVLDPASGPLEGDPPGVNPVVYVYADHPVVNGLGPTRMTFLLRARPVIPRRKPQPDDELRALAFTSPRAWLAAAGDAVAVGRRERPPEAPEEYLPLVALGRYPRPGRETRILVFGDGDFASNRYLRSLYNMDLLLNGVHWVTERNDAITLRPKGLAPDQFPLTPQQTLRMLYGVGLLLPELLLMAGGIVWLRRRGA